jgi:hypothetical protein
MPPITLLNAPHLTVLDCAARCSPMLTLPLPLLDVQTLEEQRAIARLEEAVSGSRSCADSPGSGKDWTASALTTDPVSSPAAETPRVSGAPPR